VRAHLAEALGTFAIVFLGCGAVAVDAQSGQLGHAGIAFAFGLVVAAMIYSLGHISGAHFNPAVSVGFAMGGHFPWSRVATYATAQTAGAIAGALLLRVTMGDGANLGLTQPSGSDLQSFAWEVALTFVLMLVITAVATDIHAVGEAAAIAIGGTVALAAMVGGPVSGASMNPARSLGPALVAGDLTSIWVYLVAPVVGAMGAAFTYRYLRSPHHAPARVPWPNAPDGVPDLEP